MKGVSSRPPWDLKKSVFSSIKTDTEDALDNAFMQDWRYCKIPRMINAAGKSEDLAKQELDQVRNLLRKWYPKIKSVFKDVCVQSTEIYNMGMNALSDLLNSTGSPRRCRRCCCCLLLFVVVCCCCCCARCAVWIGLDLLLLLLRLLLCALCCVVFVCVVLCL